MFVYRHVIYHSIALIKLRLIVISYVIYEALLF
jgi:hypothetical protein